MSWSTEIPMPPFRGSQYPSSHGVVLSISVTDASGNTTALEWAAPSTLEDLEQALGSLVSEALSPLVIPYASLKGSLMLSFSLNLDTMRWDSQEPNRGSDTGIDSSKTSAES